MKIAIVTAADSKFFGLLRGLVLSIRDKPQGRSVGLSVLDVGLTEVDRRWLDGYIDSFATPDWDLKFDDQKSTPEYQMAFYARPFLPRYFPGHDVYLWMDADTWVQDWAAVDLYIKASESGDLAITPEIDRAYRDWLGSLKLKRFLGLPRRLKSWIYDIYRDAYGKQIADHLAFHPVINNGVFALRGDSPHWQTWATCFQEGLRRTSRFGLDQASLNYAIYLRGVDIHFLPSWCNWMCPKALPVLDPTTGSFLEPFLPHHRIGIMHLSNTVKDNVMKVATTDADSVRTALTYAGTSVRKVEAFHGGAAPRAADQG